MTLALKISDRIISRTIGNKSSNETVEKDRCFRLAHDGKKVIHFFEAKGFTITGLELIAGSKEECQAEMIRLGLSIVELQKEKLLT